MESYPEGIEADGQDIMQVYNLHRFRTTDPNFQFIKIGDVNFSSYYSGGYKSNYIGKPNYCVTLLLEATDNPSKYERVLLKACNNLLLHMNDDDFDLMLQKYYMKISAGDFDSIKIERQEGVPAPKEEGEEGSEEVSDERKILENLIASTDTEEAKAEEKVRPLGPCPRIPSQEAVKRRHQQIPSRPTPLQQPRLRAEEPILLPPIPSSRQNPSLK